MTRQALVVGEAIGADIDLEPVLQRYGFTRVRSASDVAEALEAIGQEHFDLLFVPIDEIDELQLAALDRAGRRERHMGVVATGPRSDPELMLRAMRAGIQEFLVRPIVLTDLVAAVERLNRRTTSGITSGQVFAVFGTKGGVGASTTAANLAYSLSRGLKQGRVAVADLALAGGDIRVLLNVKPSYDLGDLASKSDRLDADLLNSVLVPASEGLWVLAAPDRPEAEEAVDANVVTNVVQQLRAAFVYSVLDCERELNDRTLSALDAADRVLLLTELKVPAMRSAQRALGIFRRLGYANDKICIVVNRYQSGDVVSASEAADVLKADLFFKLPNDYRVASESATAGMPVGKTNPESKLAYAYDQLAQKLAGGPEIPQNGRSALSSARALRGLFTRKRK